MDPSILSSKAEVYYLCTLFDAVTLRARFRRGFVEVYRLPCILWLLRRSRKVDLEDPHNVCGLGGGSRARRYQEVYQRVVPISCSVGTCRKFTFGRFTRNLDAVCGPRGTRILQHYAGICYVPPCRRVCSSSVPM